MNYHNINFSGNWPKDVKMSHIIALQETIQIAARTKYVSIQAEKTCQNRTHLCDYDSTSPSSSSNDQVCLRSNGS